MRLDQSDKFEDVVTNFLIRYRQNKYLYIAHRHSNISTKEQQRPLEHDESIDFDESHIIRQSADNWDVSMFETEKPSDVSENVNFDENMSIKVDNEDLFAPFSEEHVKMDEVLGNRGDEFNLPNISDIAPFLSL